MQRCACDVRNIMKDNHMKKNKTAIVLLAVGFELVEAMTVVDYLRRVDVEVTTVTIGSEGVRSQRDVEVRADRLFAPNLVLPDAVIVPVGNGTLFSAVFKGFMEMKKIGLTTRIPMIIGVQIKGASPIKKALEEKKDYAILESVRDSIAEGIVARESYDSPKVCEIINSGHGEIMEVSEAEVKKSLKKIIETESLVPEPTSAVVYAALDKIEKEKNMDKMKRVVCVQTGSGMKNVEELLHILEMI